MQTQGANAASWNNFVDVATKALACDAECQRNKTIDELKSEYLSAKENVAFANPRLALAEKNWIVYNKGDAGYQEYQEQKYKAESEVLQNRLAEKMEKMSDTISREIESYISVRNSVAHSIALYKKFADDNKAMERKLADMTKTTAVNERKTYYEEQDIAYLDTIYRWIWMAYNVCLVGLGMWLIYDWKNASRQKIAILILAVIYPFISTQLLGVFISAVYWILRKLPANVFPNT